MFKNNFDNKTVLVTGHTGFKGSWLSIWLKTMGANVIGLSLDPITNPSLFDVSNLNQDLESHKIDIRESDKVKNLISSIKPDYIFHLAAQSLVRNSYTDPLKTWTTNLIGTINILNSLRYLDKKCISIFITSDKCYDNLEWTWGYRENDKLGGEDPYSASKGSCELAIRSYVKSFYTSNQNILIGSARAGNVIGGGDWSENRIIPDCIRAWSASKSVSLRNPISTRPWQHVLEPLSGYLKQAVMMSENSTKFHGEAFNFGPPSSQNISVLELVETMSKYWSKVKWNIENNDKNDLFESGLLKLNCDKALHLLNWQATLDFEKTVKMTVEWYRDYYNDPLNAKNKTLEQISEYESISNKDKTK